MAYAGETFILHHLLRKLIKQGKNPMYNHKTSPVMGIYFFLTRVLPSEKTDFSRFRQLIYLKSLSAISRDIGRLLDLQ